MVVLVGVLGTELTINFDLVVMVGSRDRGDHMLCPGGSGGF